MEKRLLSGEINDEQYKREFDWLPILHAKVIVVDRKEAFIGSANISRKAMNDNYEIGMLIGRGSRHPDTLAKMVENIAENMELCEEIS